MPKAPADKPKAVPKAMPKTAKPAPKFILSDASKAQKKRSTLNNAAEKMMFGARSKK